MSIIDGVPITGRESLDIRKAAGKKAACKKEAENETAPLPKDVPDIASLKSQKYHYSASTGNQVTPLIGGEQIFSAAEKAMKGAEKTIQLQMYRLGYDKVIDVLADQAKSGVKVQVLLDPTPGYDAEDIEDQKRIRNYLKASGVELLTYPPGDKDKIDHVKLLIIDGRTALIGGMNWDKHSPKNQDADILIEGPAVGDLGKIFKDDWKISGGKVQGMATAPPPEQPEGDARIRVIETDNGVQDIRKAMVENIEKAKKSIKIEAFVLCDKQVVQGLIDAHNRGVDVKVILDPNKPVFYPNLKTEKILQEAGIEVRWLNVNAGTQEKLHAKIATFDDETTIIGSCNFSYQGLTVNHEADVEVISKSLGTAFENMFQDHWDKRTSPTAPKLPDFQELTDDAPPLEQAARSLFRYFNANWSPAEKHNWVGKRKAAVMEEAEDYKSNGA
ncbi:MAG: phosphatidylserine/phosphatidylglycerophosphate/cardiolipin synthase family protein, partial [Armatimonadetes bacterium]|nr:phosphatidylserine/phosphatidylglycerophosphate/cardiolipin synthase family protein [Armatimonadota bacterium]